MASGAIAQSEPQAHYVVRIRDLESREALVEARFAPRNGRLTMGRSGAAQHLEEGFATYVHDLVAHDAEGNRLEVEDLRSANWRVGVEGEVRLSYRVELTHDQSSWPFGYDEASYSFHEGFFFVGESLFVSTPGLEGVRVRFDVPEEWRVSTPWKEDPGEESVFHVRDDKELAKSCVMVGSHLLRTIRAGKTEVDLAFGHEMAAAVDPLESALRLLLDAYTRLFGGGRSARFLIALNRARYNGAGAYPSSISILSKEPGQGERVEMPLLYMVAHEVLHLWNGRQLTPRGQAEWFKEGITDYLTLMTLRRVGLASKEWLYEALAEHVGKYRAALGDTSIARAGFRKADNYDLVYSGGAMVGWALDLELRAARSKGPSLDLAMRTLFRHSAGEASAFDRGDLIAALEKVSGRDFTSFFARFVDDTELLELDSALKALGLGLRGGGDGGGGDDDGEVTLVEVPEPGKSQQALREAWLEGR